MNVLVTGGAGFIGSFIVDELVRMGHGVTVFDNLDPQVHKTGDWPLYKNPEVEYVRGDVRDPAGLKKVLVGKEAVFHYASAVGVGQSQYQIRHYVDVNEGGTANLLDLIVNHSLPIKKVVLAASMSSYGEGNFRCATCGVVRPGLRPEEQMARGDWNNYCPTCRIPVSPIPTDEGAVQQCNSMYAITKMNQEQMVANICRTYNVPYTNLRYFNVYGPRQSLSNPYTGVAAIFMSRIKNDHPPVVYEDGLQTRDFVSVHDVALANMLALERAGSDYKTINIGNGVPVTIRGMAEQLAVLCGRGHIRPNVQNKFRKGDVRHCYADIALARKCLGFEPRVPFENGMRELIDWSKGIQAEDRFDQAEKELKEKGLV